MRRRQLWTVGALLLLAALGAALRFDLAQYRWRQGRACLAAGDYRGALALLRRAGQGNPGSLPVAFDEGIALYRLGDFLGARQRFASSAASANAELKAAALYNMGNCAFRQGEKSAASDRQAARRRFEEAAGAYRQALAFAPGAADARHNLGLVRIRLAGWTGAEAGRNSDRAVGRGTAPAGERTGADAAHGSKDGKDVGNGKTGRDGKDALRDGEASAGRGAGRGRELAGPPGQSSAAPATSGKTGPKLTRDEAEQLLSEARSREALVPAAPGKSAAAGRLARPDRDW